MVVEIEQDPPSDFAVLARRLTHERMEYYGYPRRVVEQLERQTHDGAHHHVRHCERTDHGWDCADYDRDGEPSRHPDHDEYERTAEWVVWLLEALDAEQADGRHKAAA